MLQQWHCSPINDIKCNSRQPHSIQITLQDCRHPIPPSRENKDNTLTAPKLIDFVLDVSPIRTQIVVRPALSRTEYGLKMLLIEVESFDLVSRLAQRSDDAPI